MPSPPLLPPLMAFDEACRLVVEHLKREVPLAFWSVSRLDDGKQIHVCVKDDFYGKAAGSHHAWSDSFCQYAVAGVAPQIAPDAMAVPEYAATKAARDQEIGAYVGVPIRNGDGSLYGTICGLDPRVASARLTEHGVAWKVYFDRSQTVSLTGLIHAPTTRPAWKTNFAATAPASGWR